MEMVALLQVCQLLNSIIGKNGVVVVLGIVGRVGKIVAREDKMRKK